MRGKVVNDTGAPIMIPVGTETLGRIINVIGDPIDERGPLPTDKRQVRISVVDPHPFDADPDSTYHPDVDPDSDFLFDVDPDPTFHLDADPDPTFHLDADPDPTFHLDAILMRIRNLI